MTRSQRALAAAFAVAASAALVIAAPTRADDTGVGGEVDSMIELRLDPLAKGKVAATVTTTVGHVRLSGGTGPKDTTRDFAQPVTGARVVVQSRASAGAAESTITLGPQGP